MAYQTTIRGEQFRFADLRAVFARANEEKSGDQLAGVAARTERERVAAKLVLADVRLSDIVDQPFIEPEQDDVTRLILESLDHDSFNSIRSLTVGEFREFLLDDRVTGAQLGELRWALTPEVVAAAANLMSNKD